MTKVATAPANAKAPATRAKAADTVSLNTNTADQQAARNEAANRLQKELADVIDGGQTVSVKDFFKAAGLTGISPRLVTNGSGYLYATVAKGSQTTSIYLSKGLAQQVMEEHTTETEATSTGKEIVFVNSLKVDGAFLSDKTITASLQDDGSVRLKLGRAGSEGIEINEVIWD